MSYADWMSACSQIHGLPLKNIIMPCSHDAGSYALSNKMTPDPSPQYQSIIQTCQTIANKIDAIPIFGALDPLEWVTNAVVGSIKDFSTTTTSTVLQQLNDGIRGLDLRVLFDVATKTFHTYHGLEGPLLSEILDDIVTFVTQQPGEVVYIVFGHGLNSDSSTPFDYSALWGLVGSKLSKYALTPTYDGKDTPSNDFFNITYTDLLAAGSSGCSTVILVDGDNLNPCESFAWPKTFSAPDNSSGNTTLGGLYSNTDDYNQMVSEQTSNLTQADGKPFALYLTLTPQSGNLEDALMGAASGPVAASVIRFPFAAAEIEAAAIFLKTKGDSASYSSLKQLADTPDKNLPGLMATSFLQTGQSSKISQIWIDYYESTALVKVCIAMNAQQWPGGDYLFGYSPDAGHWFLQELLSDGLMGLESQSGPWNNPYASLFPFLASDGQQYVFGLNQESNYWFIQQILPKGQLGSETDNGHWGNFYDPVVPLTVQGQTYIIGQNPSSGFWFIQQINNGGKMGSETDNGTWNNCYDVMLPIMIQDRTFVFAHNTDTNYYFVQEILPGGKMGQETTNGHWANPYACMTSLTVQGSSGPEFYIMGQNQDTNYWFIQQILPGGLIGTETDNGHWNNAYGQITSYIDGTGTFIVGFNQSTNYWFVQQVLPGGKMGAESCNGHWRNSYATVATVPRLAWANV